MRERTVFISINVLLLFRVYGYGLIQGQENHSNLLHAWEAEIMVVFYDCTRKSTEMQDREDRNGRLVVYLGFWFLFRLPFHSQDLL